ncbi:hypothetical protein AB4Y43_01220 [Paraburkholderia sp. BR10872]|uniref:hypothetical protein n=1 Tax=Paraburkholderia sp. BR10872 TaxID=3236989 RepID=UPI0034D22BA1
MNVKAGDLAIVIHSENGDGIGMVLKVVSAWGRYPEYGFLWNVETPREVRTWSGRMTRFPQIPDAWLKPVSGLPIEDEVTDEIKELA